MPPADYPPMFEDAVEISSLCLACGSAALRSFYRVTSIPVHSCVLLETREAALAFPRSNLELAFCEGCGFIQNVLFDSVVARLLGRLRGDAGLLAALPSLPRRDL